MDFRLRLPGAIYRQARDKAGDDASLAALLVRYVTQYATGTTAQQRGGVVASAKLTTEERRARASAAATARWQRHRTTPDR